MPVINGTTGVVGTDQVVPIYDPEGRWCFWSLSEIYTGQQGFKKYVPKVNDYVIDIHTYTTYIVEYLDPVTLIPTLREIRPANMSFSLTETDVLFGVGPGTQSDTYRVYIDDSVTPHVVSVDNRLKIAGTMSSYAKLYKGSDLSSSGDVISKTYDSQGNFISENVGLELVAIDSHVNYSIKTIKVCHTTHTLQDGEIVTAVIYSDNGHVVSKRQLLVENTSFIRSINISQKYITHISLECPFLSSTIDHQINFPLNIPLNSLNAIGVVHYSNGEKLRLPIDGNKFSLYGLDQYVSSIIGQKIELVLSYNLSFDEVAYSTASLDVKTINEPYDLITINPNNSYTVKLFGYPFWIDAVNGYQMRWWLLNLDRNIVFEVTPHVKYSEATGGFNPKLHGYIQTKNVSLNLRDVSGAFKNFIHTQTLDIMLAGHPGNDGNIWLVRNESATALPYFGTDVYARKIANNVINLAADFTTKEAWLDNMYYKTNPLVNPSTEVSPIVPTHFAVSYQDNSSNEVEYAISSWNSNLSLPVNVEVSKSVIVRFFKRSANRDMQLSMAVVLIK